MDLPSFDQDGLLPQGDYPLTFEGLRKSHLVKTCSSTWDEKWRMHLVNNLEIMVNQLWSVGITKIFIDGSFVENKDHPNDIDGYFECEVEVLISGELQQALNSLDPHKIWTWNRSSRRAAPNSVNLQLPMWHQYRVELYPHFGQPTSGIRDESGNDLPFPSAFRRSRNTGKQRGIILLVKSGGQDDKNRN